MNMSCPACRSSNIIQDGERGEACCGDCGMVVTDHMGHVDTGSMADTHTPVPAGERSTRMGRTAADDNSTARMRKRDGWIASHGVASALRGGSLGKLRAMHDKLGLPASVCTRAVEIYVKSTTNGDARGHHLVSMMAASLYLACREADAPRTLDDITKVSGLTRKMIAKHVRYLLDGYVDPPRQYSLPILITRIANTVGVGQMCLQAAIAAAGKLDTVYLAGKNPLVVAAATLYVTALRRSERYTEVELADAAGISTVSIRNRAREMEGMV